MAIIALCRTLWLYARALFARRASSTPNLDRIMRGYGLTRAQMSRLVREELARRG